MKFYITVEPVLKLKHAFTNLSSFYLIDVDTLVESSGLNMENPAHRYLVNTEIGRLINTGAKSKRYAGIIYINSNIDCDSITGIRESLDSLSNSVIDTLSILDDYDLPKLKPYYKLFDEVMFFPTFKKTKIIHCSSRTFDKINKKLKEND